MANHLYPLAKKLWLTTGLSMTALDIRCVLLRGYTYSAAHDFLDDVATIVSTSPTITNFTVTANVVDCDNFSFTAVAAGAACEALVWYRHTGTPGTSQLIMYYDAAPMPVTPNGEDINITIDASSPNLFRLGSA